MKSQIELESLHIIFLKLSELSRKSQLIYSYLMLFYQKYSYINSRPMLSKSISFTQKKVMGGLVKAFLF
jgi:hypothetical protein